MISSIIQAPFFFIKIQPNMKEQEKKWQRIYDLLNTKTKSKFLCLLYTKQRKIFYRKGKVGMEDWTKNKKKAFLTALATAIKKNHTMSIRKHTNQLRVYGIHIFSSLKISNKNILKNILEI